MIIRLGVVSFVFVAACASPPAATATTDYLVVQQGRRAWPLQDQALVQVVEERLQAQGFDPGPVDGVADERTRQALLDFQRSRGLSPTGILDQNSAEALGLRWKRVAALVRAGRLNPL